MVSSETATRTGAVIVQAESVTKTFTTPDGHALPVLEGVSFTLSEGEIVALLGKSGSGKSTLLRCVAGLIPPSSGSVSYRGTPLTGAIRGWRWFSRPSRCCRGSPSGRTSSSALRHAASPVPSGPSARSGRST